MGDGPLLTLAVDIGGSGIKAAVLDARGELAHPRARAPTPQPATPAAVLATLAALVEPLRPFHRAAVGFPGVVEDGRSLCAANLADGWCEFPLAASISELLHVPVRAANDADVHGFAAIDGQGTELVLTLGTGVGSALFIDGRLVPNLELGHHRFRKGRTYEEQLGRRALESAGKRRWNRRLRRAIASLRSLFYFRRLYLGGGNAKAIRGELPEDVAIISNELGLRGGLALWSDLDCASPDR